jgi:hypothetical protein
MEGYQMPDTRNDSFEKVAHAHVTQHIGLELWEFISHNKTWWMLPIVLALLFFGLLILLSSSGIAPFIYTLF